MRTTNESFTQVIAEFEKEHQKDPNREMSDGKTVPEEWLYMQRLVSRLKQYSPKASEELILAAYCQHLHRWEIARNDYPDGKTGYFEWRTFLSKYQSQKAAEILSKAGYPPGTIDRIRSLTAKENLKSDKEAQTLEDVVCLVFMEHYLDDFAAKNPHLEFKRIIFKTLNKMSKRGIEEAGKIAFPAPIREIMDEVIPFLKTN